MNAKLTSEDDRGRLARRPLPRQAPSLNNAINVIQPSSRDFHPHLETLPLRRHNPNFKPPHPIITLPWPHQHSHVLPFVASRELYLRFDPKLRVSPQDVYTSSHRPSQLQAFNTGQGRSHGTTALQQRRQPQCPAAPCSFKQSQHQMTMYARGSQLNAITAILTLSGSQVQPQPTSPTGEHLVALS